MKLFLQMNKLLMVKVGDLVQVERKKLNQWFFNISKFSQDLLDGLETLDEWPNKVKINAKKLDRKIIWL